MSEAEQREQRGAGERPAGKTYHKPEVRHEKVFETLALACGKVHTTQMSCHSNQKKS
ncbi:MAG: hypothetical protein ABSF46_28420 [Terriglobia bacterium]|jgi:hypothetical protein